MESLNCSEDLYLLGAFGEVGSLAELSFVRSRTARSRREVPTICSDDLDLSVLFREQHTFQI